MENAWYKLHSLLMKHRVASLLGMLLLMLGMGFLASRIHLEEDITKLIPLRESDRDLQKVLRTVKFTDKIVVNIGLLEQGEVGDLIEYADAFIDTVQGQFGGFIQNIQGKVEDDAITRTMAYVQQNMPQFLSEEDYGKLAGRIQRDSLAALNLQNYKMLISPSGFVAKGNIQNDPLGLTLTGLTKLKDIGVGDELSLYKGYLLSADRRHLLLFITPTYNADGAAENTPFAKDLYRLNDEMNEAFAGKVQAEYFGAPLIAVANAERVKADVRWSVGFAVILLLILLLSFFKRASVSLILFVPSLFGALLAVGVLYFLRDGISAISLGIGSVTLGVTLDYSLHILTHIRNRGSIAEVFQEVASPILVSSLTTACAFLCLLFLSSQALQDLGIFCAVAVMGASVFALLFIPLAYRATAKPDNKNAWIDRIAGYSHQRNRWLLGAIGILVLVSCFTYSKVSFNNDLAQLNYMPAHLQLAQDNLDSLTSLASKSIQVVAYAADLDQALQANDQVFNILKQLQAEERIIGFSSIAAAMNSSAEQARRVNRWNTFWTSARKDTLRVSLITSGAAVGFRPSTYQPFYDVLDKGFSIQPQDPLSAMGAIDPKDFISQEDGFYTVATLVRVEYDQLPDIRARFLDMENVLTVDRQQTKESFLGDLKNDFNELIFYSTIVVLLILLLYFRSAALVLVTALPIVITWLLTIGSMGLLGLQLNIFNIIICTFIFGLGIDYSIFITKGLLQELRSEDDHLRTYKTSIILSVITTLLGVGVLAFAKHPALYSISVVSIIGILAAMLVAFTLQPWIFRLFVGGHEHRPVSLRMFLYSVLSFTYFGLGGLLLSFCATFILPLIPVSKKVKMGWFHRIIAAFKRSVLYSNPFVKKQVINTHGETFQEPAIMIANHSSFLDILATGMLHPKTIFLVNDWVHDSPVFGKVVRLAGGYPVSQGLESGLDHLKEKVRQGYSVMIFPEGSRSRTHGIRRFHKGAFFLAHQFQLDIVPVLIHGNSEVLPKNTYVIRDGRIDIKIMPRIKYGTPEFGKDHRDTTKRISKLFKAEFLAFRRQLQGPGYFHPQVLDDYRFREPERYRELKVLLKQRSEEYHELMTTIPQRASILHISNRGGHVGLLLAMDGPFRKLLTFINDENDRAVVKNGVVSRTKGDITVLATKCEAMQTHADILLVEEGAISDNEMKAMRERFPNSITMHT